MILKSIIVLSAVGVFLVVSGIIYVGSTNTHNSTMMMSFSPDGNSKSIHMGMSMFMPNQLKVAPNTQVTWQTHDMETHNVYGIFKTYSGKEITILSGDIKHMDDWSYTFEESGVFEYACGYHEHEGMEGKLIVSAV